MPFFRVHIENHPPVDQEATSPIKAGLAVQQQFKDEGKSCIVRKVKLIREDAKKG